MWHRNRSLGASLDDANQTTPATLRHPADRRRLTYMPDDPLLTAREAAAERGQALSTFWRDVAAGRVPPAYYVSPHSRRSWRPLVAGIR